jgi:hypothetical protein
MSSNVTDYFRAFRRVGRDIRDHFGSSEIVRRPRFVGNPSQVTLRRADHAASVAASPSQRRFARNVLLSSLSRTVARILRDSTP